MSATVLIHATDPDAAAATVAAVRAVTPPALLRELLVLDQTGVQLEGVRVLPLPHDQQRWLGYNRGAEQAQAETLLFLRQGARPQPGWLEPLLERLAAEPAAVVGPVLYDQQQTQLRLGWGWELQLRPVPDSGEDWAACLSLDCLAVRAARFRQLGGFDCGPPEELEFCLRNWLCGGAVRPVRQSQVQLPGLQLPPEQPEVLDRVAELWLGRYRRHYYRERGRAAAGPGRWAGLLAVRQQLQQRSLRDWIQQYQPELGRIYELHQRHRGASVAIVCPGPSADQLDPIQLDRHDLVLGLDHMALQLPCDYVLSLQPEPVRALLLSGRYAQSRLLLPTLLAGEQGPSCVTREVAPGATLWARAEPGAAPGLTPPWADYGHPLHPALQAAAWLGAREVVLYGWDGRLVAGRSHTSRGGSYGDGHWWPESDATRQRLAYYEAGLQQVITALGIPVLKVCYA